MDRLSDISNALITVDLPPALGSGGDLQALLGRQLQRMIDLCATLSGDFQQIFGADGPSIRDLDLEKIKQIVLAVGLRIAEAAVAATKDLIFALIDALAGLVDTFRQIMFATVRIPLIEALWELVGGEQTDLSFTLIDAVLLPVAVLTTIAFKLILPDQDIRPVLAVSVPRGASYGAQSSSLVTILSLVMGLAGNLMSLVSIMVDAGDAAAETIVKRASKFSVFTLVARTAAHILNAVKLTQLQSRVIALAEWVIWVLGGVELFLKGAKIWGGDSIPGAYEALVKGAAAVEIVCSALKALIKTAGWADDPDHGYTASEVVPFYGAALARALMASARLTDNVKAKADLVLAGQASAFFLVGICSIIHYSRAFKRDS
jgi:hypothetical protein